MLVIPTEGVEVGGGYNCSPVLNCGSSGTTTATSTMDDIRKVCRDACLSLLEVKKVPAAPKCIEQFKPRDCQEIQSQNSSASTGVYVIFPSGGNDGVQVRCDMDTDKGGWTIFQRRINGQVDFSRTWDEYKNGFGNVETEFYLGNENIYHLLSQKDYKLRVDMTHPSKGKKYATYKQFYLFPEILKYKLYVTGYQGDAGDSLNYHSNRPFTTKDRDNDEHRTANCGSKTGGWWYGGCKNANLNALYGRPDNTGVTWYTVTDDKVSLTFAEMKIRA